jgi:hypothetical protein
MKAFDTIDHTNVLHKLEFYGIRGITLEWFNNYLSNRTQFVKYQNAASDYENMTCGVPQGSVLGPLLFIIYVNDLPHCLNHNKSIQFADDTSIYASGKDIPELYANMNEDLHTLTDWFYANKLSLNVSKSNYMLFTKCRHSTADTYSLKIANEEIARTSCFKLLGIHLDEKLQWSKHINTCHTKLISALYIITKMKDLLPLNTLKTLYYTLVYPHLNYGIILWGSAYQVHMNKLSLIQKKIIRAVSNVGHYEHTQPLFVQLDILKLDDMYEIETLKFMHQYVNGELPSSLHNIFVNTSTVHNYDTRQSRHIRPFHPRTNLSLKSLLCNGPKLWNNLPIETQNIPNIKHFAHKCKKNKIRRYEDM